MISPGCLHPGEKSINVSSGMQGLTSPLWPIRYKPFDDELLSSWLVRLARGHGLRVQTFCNLLFGNRLQVWNRDIDRLGPDWLVDVLSERTGTPIETARGTTLRSYVGVLYSTSRASGTLQWITTLQVFHRTRHGYGMQYCAKCLLEDKVPYFRKIWRVAFVTTCLVHQCMLRDRCHTCGEGVAFHRGDMGTPQARRRESLADCFACGNSLASELPEPVECYDLQAMQWLSDLQRAVMSGASGKKLVDEFNVMRQMSLLLLSKYPSLTLHSHICAKLNLRYPEMTSARQPLESRALVERHHLAQLASWLMMDLESRLKEAWRAKAVRYNHLLKDFDNAPTHYQKLVGKFSNWRDI